MISVIIPAYNEEQMILKTAQVIGELLEDEEIEYELIFVDDGSNDRTWECICSIAGDKVKGIRFSRNFGKEAAISAGLCEAKGECEVVIDCDLQHPPEKILEMYELWKQGYEVVEGVKISRGKESRGHRFASDCFYKLISSATGIDMSHASDFKLLDHKVVDVLGTFKEKDAFFLALSSWVGFRTGKVTYNVHQREAGISKWSRWALIKYAISNITSFTTLPMQIVTFLGGIMLIIAITLSGIAFYQKLVGIALGGFTTVIILICFIGSIMMVSMGIMGYYVAKIFDEVKNRPKYIIGAKTNDE